MPGLLLAIATVSLSLGCASPAPSAAQGTLSSAACLRAALGDSTTGAARLAELLESASEPGAFRLTIREDELASYVSRITQGSGFADIRVGMSDGRLCGRARVGLRGPRPPSVAELQIVLRPNVVAGKLRVVLEVVAWNQQRLPQILLRASEMALNDALTDASLGVVLESIAIEEGILTVEGVSQ